MMEFCTHGKIYYFVTYKRLGTVKIGDYEICKDVLSRRGTIISERYETDSKGKLHYHCIYECRKNPFVKSFTIRGYNVKFEDIYDRDQMIKYLNKQCKSDYENNQLLDSIYARENYLF